MTVIISDEAVNIALNTWLGGIPAWRNDATERLRTEMRAALTAALPFLPVQGASEPRELALEEAAHDLINELSENPGELIDRMAAAIRDWGSHYDDGPWETLPEDRKAGWRGDAERALAVVKEYLTARRPSEQAVTEAMVEAVQRIRNTAMRQSIVARIPECGEFGGIAQDADWLLDTLKAAREAGR